MATKKAPKKAPKKSPAKKAAPKKAPAKKAPVKKKPAKKAAPKVKRPKKKLLPVTKEYPTKPKEEHVTGVCDQLECKRPSRTRRSKWCDFHNNELRLIQLREAGRRHRKAVKQNHAQRREQYGKKPTKRAAAGKLRKPRAQKNAPVVEVTAEAQAA